MSREDHIILNCRQCGEDFVFSESEQEFYKEKGFDPPRRCKKCRSAEQKHFNHLTCSKCGIELEEDSPVLCNDCLTTIEKNSKQKIGKMKEALNLAYASIKTIESENEDLEQKVNALSKDLEKVNELHSSLNDWFQPALGGIEQRLKDRIEVLERGQNKINERMLQLVEKIHSMYEDTTIFDIIKHSFKHHQEQGRQTT
jgi:chaperonin cofactor prefoldin